MPHCPLSVYAVTIPYLIYHQKIEFVLSIIMPTRNYILFLPNPVCLDSSPLPFPMRAGVFVFSVALLLVVVVCNIAVLKSIVTFRIIIYEFVLFIKPLLVTAVSPHSPIPQSIAISRDVVYFYGIFYMFLKVLNHGENSSHST